FCSKAFGRHRTAVNHSLGILGDIDKSACASQTGTELGYVQVTVWSRLSQSQERDIQTAALIEIELYVMGQNRHGVGRCAKLSSAIGNAGDGTSLYRQRHAVGDAFFRSHIGDFFRSSGTQVND